MTTHSPSMANRYMHSWQVLLPHCPRRSWVHSPLNRSTWTQPVCLRGVSAPGAVMPDGELLDVHGAATSLARVRADRPAVVVFYRGAWCPYCNIALRTYQAELAPALADRGFALIAVSPQKPDGSLTAAETNELSYSVVSDPGNQIASALGIVTEPSAEAVAAQDKLGLDLAEQNADGGRRLPMPTTVVVDATGVIRWIDVHPNYTTRSEVSEILAAVDAVS